MKKLIILVNSLEDWQSYYPSEDIMTAKDYLLSSDFTHDKKTKVINLCKSYKYLSIGYYCSLLAESRGHKVIPSVKTINDLGKKQLYLYDLDELQINPQDATRNFLHNQSIKSISFRCYFGKVQERLFKDLARQIFEQFPCPILEVKLTKKNYWTIEAVTPIGFPELVEDEEEKFAKSIEKYSTKIWRLPNAKKKFVFDLAILVNPQEKLPPSDEGALKNFERVCSKLDIYTERITKKDYSRINEFDGIFIRETTSIKNHTYTFARRAASEGLVVLDDPTSILKCTNKIFMFNLMRKNNIDQIESRFVSDAKESTLDALVKTFGFPMVLKIPDGSFSLGVKKAENIDELKDWLNTFFKKSSLVLIQKFVPTEFDWRIGVLDGEVIYACKYFMSKGHWQIYDHNNSKGSTYGDVVSFKIEDVPKKVIDTSLKITKLLGNSLYGVDLKYIDGKALVVEVNDNPNLDEGVEEEILGDVLYEKIAKYFLKYQQKNWTNLTSVQSHI